MGLSGSRATSPNRGQPHEELRETPDLVLLPAVPVSVIGLGNATNEEPEATAVGRASLASRTVSQGDVARRRASMRSGARPPLPVRALTIEDNVVRDVVPVAQQQHRPRPRSRLNSTRPGPSSQQVAALYTEAVANIEQTRLVRTEGSEDPVEPSPSAVEAVVGSNAPPQVHVAQVPGKPFSSVRRTGSAVSAVANEEPPAKHTTSEGAFLRSSTALPPARGVSHHLDLPDNNSPATPVPEVNLSASQDSLSVRSDFSTAPKSEGGDACDIVKPVEEIIEINLIAPASADGFYFGASCRLDDGNTDYFAQVQQATLASLEAGQILEEESEDEPCDPEERTLAEGECASEVVQSGTEQAQTRHSTETASEPTTKLEDESQQEMASGPKESNESNKHLGSDQLAETEENTTKPAAASSPVGSRRDLRHEVMEIVMASAMLTAASSIAAPSGSLTAINDSAEVSRSEEDDDQCEAAGDDSLVGCEVHLKAVAGGMIEQTTDVAAAFVDREQTAIPAEMRGGVFSTSEAFPEEDEEHLQEEETGCLEVPASLAPTLELRRHVSEKQKDSNTLSVSDEEVTDKEESEVLASRSESSTGRIRALGRITTERERHSDSSNRFNKMIQNCKQKLSGKTGTIRRALEKRPHHRFKLHRFSKTALQSAEVTEKDADLESSQDQELESVDVTEPEPRESPVPVGENKKPSRCPSEVIPTDPSSNGNYSQGGPSDLTLQAATENPEGTGRIKKNLVVPSLSPSYGSKNRIVSKRSQSNRSRSFSIESESHSRSSRVSIAPPRTNFLTDDILRSLTKSYDIRYIDLQVGPRPRQASKTPERYRSSPGHRKVLMKSGNTSAGSTASSSVANTPKAGSGMREMSPKQKVIQRKKQEKVKSCKQVSTEKNDETKFLSAEHIIPSNQTTIQSSQEEIEVTNTEESLHVCSQDSMPTNELQSKGNMNISKRKPPLPVPTHNIDHRKNYQKILESSLENVKTFKEEFDVLLENPQSKLLEKSESLQENAPVSGYMRAGKPHSCILRGSKKDSQTFQDKTPASIATLNICSQSKDRKCSASPSKCSRTAHSNVETCQSGRVTNMEGRGRLESLKTIPRKSAPKYRPTLRTPRISSVGMHAAKEVPSLLIYKNVIPRINVKSRARISMRPSRILQTGIHQSKSTKMTDCTESEGPAPLAASFEGIKEMTRLLRRLADLENSKTDVSELVSLFEAPTQHSLPSEDNESRACLGTSPRPSADEVGSLDPPKKEASRECESTAQGSKIRLERASASVLQEAKEEQFKHSEIDNQADARVEVVGKLEDEPPNKYSICSRETEIRIAATLHETVNSSLNNPKQGPLDSQDPLDTEPAETLQFIEASRFEHDETATQLASTLQSIEASRFEHDETLYQLDLPLIHISPPFPEEDTSGRESPLTVRIDSSLQGSNTDQSTRGPSIDIPSLKCKHSFGFQYSPSAKVSTFTKAASLFRSSLKVSVDKGINTNAAEDNVSATVNTSTWSMSPSRHTIEKVSDAVQASVATADADAQAFFSYENVSEDHDSDPVSILRPCTQEKLFYRRNPFPTDTAELEDDKVRDGLAQMMNILECSMSQEFIPRSCNQLVMREGQPTALKNHHHSSAGFGPMNGPQTGQIPRHQAPKLAGVDRARLRVANRLNEDLSATVQAVLNEVLPVLLERSPSELHCKRQNELKKVLTDDFLNHPSNQHSEIKGYSNEEKSFIAEMAEKIALFVEDTARSTEGIRCYQDSQKPP